MIRVSGFRVPPPAWFRGLSGRGNAPVGPLLCPLLGRPKVVRSWSVMPEVDENDAKSYDSRSRKRGARSMRKSVR